MSEVADKVKAINKVEEIGSKYGIGRDMHIGDTIIGIKHADVPVFVPEHNYFLVEVVLQCFDHISVAVRPWKYYNAKFHWKDF